ncbi:restriction endonuclease subunit S [Rhodanobacter ginsengisoli]|uniref:Restriction endonuclease subunit S n=1 Tax=Rhodanobacter ginsengisoli TaxID=418646 RepID=A0ABW0QRB1_9GAMM
MTLPPGWTSRRLSQLGELCSGSTPSSSRKEYWNGATVWVTPTDLSRLNTPYLYDSAKHITERGLRNCSAPLLPAGSIVLSSRAPIGYVAIPTAPFCTNQGCKSIALHDSYHSEFIYYAVTAIVPRLKQLGEGTTFAEISKSSLAKVEVVLPSDKAEQSKIAEVLSTVDRAIEQTEVLIAKRQRIKTGLTQELLTCGIDEHGNLRSEQTHEFKDSPLGRIPVEWESASLAVFVPSADYGISTSLGEFGSPVLRMNNLLNGEAELSDLKFTDAPVPEHLWLKDGDVLFNRTNSWEHVGRTGIWRGQIERATFASYLVRLNPHPDKLLPEMLNFWLNSDRVQIAMRRQATPAVQQVNINPTNLRSIPAAFPTDLDEQRAIAVRIAAVNEVLNASRKHLNKLKSVKAGLMHDLLTGDRRVTALLQSQKEEVGA